MGNILKIVCAVMIICGFNDLIRWGNKYLFGSKVHTNYIVSNRKYLQALENVGYREIKQG